MISRWINFIRLGVISFVTAVSVARWVARAYGYVAMKRRAYLHPSRVSTVDEIKTDIFLLDY